MNRQSLEELLVEIAHSQLLSHEEEIALLKVVQEKGTDCDEMKIYCECGGSVSKTRANTRRTD